MCSCGACTAFPGRVQSALFLALSALVFVQGGVVAVMVCSTVFFVVDAECLVWADCLLLTTVHTDPRSTSCARLFLKFVQVCSA